MEGECSVISLRKATAEDCRRVFEWRNDPVTRAMFRNHDEVTWETHLRWFMARLTDANCLMLIAMHGRAGTKPAPCGVARFDAVGGDLAEVSVNVSPAYRNQGLGTEILQQATREALKRWRWVRADILPANVASFKAFLNAGYRPDETVALFAERADG